ncbi:hypothetical protein JKF63_05981 [Porcisia hertigi]|uniref:non-specific serine/threonine protein kinase n=1 Tax=Porcisia hertigi TaxID=2761500 RepID=A0A836IQQ8_9TRYP|nr:hypothetical protein JKF63_05981 [Porcisia hertigi]
MQQMHWTAGRGQSSAPQHSQYPLPQVSTHASNRHHHHHHQQQQQQHGTSGVATPGMGGSGAGMHLSSGASAGAATNHANVHSNTFYSSRFAQPAGPQQTGHHQQQQILSASQQSPGVQQQQQQQQQQRSPQPLPGPNPGNVVNSNRNGLDSSVALSGREAPAITGANSAAAAHASSSVAGVFFSGTRTNFTDFCAAAATTATYGIGAGGVGSSEGPNANVSSILRDANDEELNQLFRELECSVDSPHSLAVLRDAVDAIEARALANFDPLSRDTFLEQRIRDVLIELSRTSNERSLLLAVNLIEALIPIAYTSPHSKYTRLCRSLSVLRQSGNEKAAREAQRVYKLLLEADARYPGPEPPLKAFVQKEIRESCEQALLQLHGRVQQAKAAFPAQFFSVMLGCAATAEVNPRYISGPARAQAIQLGMILTGSPDALLCKAAYECLVSIFRNTSSMRPNELVLENRRLSDECMRTLNASHHNEGDVVSALKTLHALLSSRGLSAIDRQVMPQLCVLVTEQHRVSKSLPVRSAVCDLVPIIALVDISSMPRRTTYCAIIMEPVKNVRDERFKAHELHNVASFVRSVGYGVFDPTNRTNLESILHRYITRSETQEACWSVMAAICASSRSASGYTASPALAGGRRVDGTTTSTAPVSPTTQNGNQDVTVTPALSEARKHSRLSSRDNVAAAILSQPHQRCFSLNDDDDNSSDRPSVLPISAATPSQRSPGIRSPTVSPTSPSAAVFNFSTASANHTLTIDDIVQHCLPFLAHAVLTQSLVDSLRVIQASCPHLRTDVQTVLDKLVDKVLKEPIALSAMGAAALPPSTAQLPTSTAQQSVIPSIHARDCGDGSVSGPANSAVGSVPCPGPCSPPVSGGPAGQLSQYFRPTENAAIHRSGGNMSSPPPSSPMGTCASTRPPPLGSNSFLGPGSAYTVGGGDANSGAPYGAGGSLRYSPINASVGAPFTPLTHTPPGGGTATAAQPPLLKNDLTVALKVFAERPVTSVQHLHDLKNSVITFQRHDDPLVRQQSSETIVSSLQQWIGYAKEHKTSTYSTRVTEILEAYMKNVLMEVDRRCGLYEITLLANATNLRAFLSEQRILSSLLSFLNSTTLVREKTVELLVAITQDSKPSPSVVAVQQSLYVTVESCVVVLEYTNDVGMLLRSMADLQTFTRLCIRPLNNHLGRIFYAFRKRLLEVSVPDVVLLFILKTLEIILQALAKEEKNILQYQDDVLELYNPVVEILKQSPSPTLSHAAINVLVYVHDMCIPSASTDLRKQQELIAALTHVYTGSSCTVAESLSMLTLFGQLGAIDPSAQSVATPAKKKEEVVIQDEADLELTYDYTVIVYRTLSRMLDASLSDAVCSQALRTLLQFIRFTQDKKDLVGGVHAVRAVLQITKRVTDSPALRVEALHVLAAVTAMRHERIARLMLPEIVVLLEQLWTPKDRPLFRAVLEVVSALKPGKLSGKEQSESWAWLYPRLVDVALQDRTESREFCLRVVEIVLNASYIPPHCIPVVFPMLLQFLQQSDQLVDVRSQSLCAAVHIVCELKAVQFFSSLLHSISTLTRHCEMNQDLGPRLSTPGVRESLKVLAALHPSGRNTIKMLRDRIGEGEERIPSTAGSSIFSSVGIPPPNVASLAGGGANSSILAVRPETGHTGGTAGGVLGMAALASSVAGPLVGGFGDSTTIGGTAAGSGSYLLRTNVTDTFARAEEEDVSPSLCVDTTGQEIALFMKHVELGFRLKESNLREWFTEFQKYIILVSPHPAFRMMVDLLDKHEPLRRGLFLPSFKCLYESLSADQIKKLNEMLTLVLNCSDHELSSKCLGLADYLDHNEPSLKLEVLEAVRSMRRSDYRRRSNSSENGSLLLRSTESSTNNVVSLRSRNSVSAGPPKGEFATSSDVPANQLHMEKARTRQGTSPRRSSKNCAEAEGHKAVTSGSGAGDGDSTAPVCTHHSASRHRKNSRGDVDMYEFASFDGEENEETGCRRKQLPFITLTKAQTQAPDGEVEQCSSSPVDTLDGADSEGKTENAVDPVNPGHPPGDVLGVAGVHVMGSYRPLVNSVVRRPGLHGPQMPTSSTQFHNTSTSSTQSTDFSTDSHETDMYPTGAHIPAQPNMLFSTEDIVRAAERTRMYDKAMSYLENRLLAMLKLYRYTKMPREVIHKTVWPLAWLYSQREMQDSVVGLFRAIRYEGGEDQAGFGYELLCWWSKAQHTYARSITKQAMRDMTVPPHILEGYVRTLTLCGEWNRAYDVAMQVNTRPEAYVSSTVARCGATAAWLLGRWDDVQHLAERLSASERHTTSLRLFFLNGVALKKAITENSSGAYDNLRHMITQSKMVIDESLRTLLPLSYTHAYENLTMLQHFTEMEEMIDYCHCHSAKGRQQICERWNNRFRLLKPDSLQPSLRSLMLHSLVLNTGEMADMILHFCETRQASYPQLTEWAMRWLRHGSVSGRNSDDSSPSVVSPVSPGHVEGIAAATLTSVDKNPKVVVGFITHLWNQGKRQVAVESMEMFLRDCGKDLEESNATCYGDAQLRLGTWKQELHADSFWQRGFRDEELGHFHKAIRAVPSSYEAWHSWGLMNYRIQQRDHNLSPEDQRTFVEAAHQGFVGAICRCMDSPEALPAVMRLLQLWVIHNGVDLLKETVADSISRIPIDHWVQTIPQLIGHLSNDSHNIREVIGMILRSLCEVHPQATVFPLLVVMMSDSSTHSSTTTSGDKVIVARKQEIVQDIIQHCPKRIFHEAEEVAKLLVDVSAIPIEKIRENLSQVAAAWNPNAEYEEDPEEVYRRLQNTLDIFHANRRHLLFTVGDIGQFVQMVMADDRNGQREKAAGVVSQLIEEISKHVAEKLGREPQKAMEPLLHLRNLSVAVFGEYDGRCRDHYPTIASFSSKLDVIPSKKRPRRIQLNGSDGCLYTYCLKGNEDIRMDERVMQLFGMVNVLLSHTRLPSSAYIHRFPVIPISSNVGLLGWVENANTINNTICNYRTNISNVRTHQESSVLRAYVESFGNWDKLSLIQRSEILDFVMQSEHCEAVDVSRAMWHRANTAEQWLDRRTAFTVSLATMSMVGYVLGLGDRHLGNILISMSSGKIVHIDFGDSFDVGRLRHALPETIPFRLTRMLTNAMEVFGVDGIFRASATRTQTTLHKNRDSIMALLSAFVHDPIVQYKGKMKNIMEKSRSPQDIAERIRHKLRGMEMAINRNKVTIFNTTQDSCRRPDLLYMSTAFDDTAVRTQSLAMTPEEQVSFLIDEATRIDNYTTMYFGWGPLW